MGGKCKLGNSKWWWREREEAGDSEQEGGEGPGFEDWRVSDGLTSTF